MNFKIISLLLVSSSLPISATALEENTSIASFNKAKKLMMKKVYFDHRETLYCGATFDTRKNITYPRGYESDKYVKRSQRVEFEHIVPASFMGATFKEWRDGHPDCVKNNGKPFKGRACASKISMEYRYIQSDGYNLSASMGSTNAMRSNYNFAMLPNDASDFGACDMRVENRKVQPPERARGQIARAYLYMDLVYERFNMSRAQTQLMNAWDKQYPTTAWECTRAKRIEKYQGNSNPIMDSRCH